MKNGIRLLLKPTEKTSPLSLWFRLKEIKTAVRGIPRTTAREKMRIAQKLKTP